MTHVKIAGLCGALLAFAACTPITDHTADRQIDSGPLEQKIKWGIYVDPDGCDTWMADNGAEGFAVARLEPETGARVCSGVLPKGQAAAHKRSSWVPDPL